MSLIDCMSGSLMPHVDLETLLRCGSGAAAASDGKIACESLFPDHLSTAVGEGGDQIPAESFRLPARDRLDWLDVHGHAFFDRTQSTKAGGRLSTAAGLQPSASASSSHRAKKSAASFFVFPKLPDSGELSRRLRRGGSRRLISRFLPKSSGRPVVPPIAEPGSPEVTCIGRVRSIRDRSLHRKKSKRANSGAKPAPAAKKSGFWSPLVAIFRFRFIRSRKSEPETTAAAVPPGEEEEEEEPKWISRSAPIGPAAGIGGMKKFASGRRSDAWAGNAVETADRSPVWRRRAAAMPPAMTVDSDRDLEDVGPKTV